MDPAVDREVVSGRLEVLTDRDDVARVASRLVVLVAWSVVVGGHRDEIIEEFEDFFFAFTDTDHDPGFGDGALCFDALEQFHRALVSRAWAHGGVTTTDSFEVVRDDVGLRVDDHLQRGFVAFEISDEDFDGHVGTGFACSQDGLGPDPGTAVGDIVAIDGCDDDVFESRSSQGLSDTTRLILIDRERLPGFDIAEPTGAGAGVSQDHDGRDPARPALSHVRTRGFFADGVEFVGVDVRFGGAEVLAAWEFGFEPSRFLFDAQVMDGIVLVVEDHGTERHSRTQRADRVSSEWARVTRERARMPGIAGFLRRGGLGWGGGIGRHCGSLCRRFGGLENGADLSGVSQNRTSYSFCVNRRRARTAQRPKTIRFSGSESTEWVLLVDGAGWECCELSLMGATLEHRARAWSALKIDSA